MPVTSRLQISARLFLAVLCGATGGLIFNLLHLPLPWMLGAITASTIAALARMPVGTPRWVRPPLSAVIGTLLGAGFPSDVLLRASDWILPLAGLAVFMLTAGAACVWYFHRVCGYDFKTAYFCGMPGGLIEMTLLGEAKGADPQRIALIHSARILLVVFIVSGVIQLFFVEGQLGSGGPADEVFRISDLSWQTAIWMTGTCVAGVALGHYLNLPAAFLLGPMLVSATLHISDLSDFEIPRELVIAAQVGLGTTIGCRFFGQTFRQVGKTLVLCLGSTFILLSMTVLFAWILHLLTGINVLLLVLAYSPGGLAEMGLVALALNFDTALVACHHLVRVVLVGVTAGYIFRWFDRDDGSGA